LASSSKTIRNVSWPFDSIWCRTYRSGHVDSLPFAASRQIGAYSRD
jgi:hypothetical protein